MNRTMIEVPPRAWRSPNFICFDTDEQGMEGFKISIQNASVELLDQMCRQFRAEIFEKAGKTDPAHTLPKQSEGGENE